MSKMRALLVGATVAGAFAASSMVPTFADPAPETPIGVLHVHGSGPDDGKIIAQGADTNPDPLDGYLSVSAGGVCTGDNSGADAAPGETCGADIITGELPA